MNETTELKLRKVLETKANIKQAINNKGGNITDDTPFDEYPTQIDNISAGANTSDATATKNDILLGKTAYTANGKVEGTIATYDGEIEGGATLIGGSCSGEVVQGKLMPYVKENKHLVTFDYKDFALKFATMDDATAQTIIGNLIASVPQNSASLLFSWRVKESDKFGALYLLNYDGYLKLIFNPYVYCMGEILTSHTPKDVISVNLSTFETNLSIGQDTVILTPCDFSKAVDYWGTGAIGGPVTTLAIDETQIPMTLYNLTDFVFQNLALGVKELKCAGATADGGNGTPIEVSELPEVGVEGAFYRLNVYGYQCVAYQEGTLTNFSDGSMGVVVKVIETENYPENPIEFVNSYTVYYITSLNNVYVYMQGTWILFNQALGNDDLSFVGVVENISEIKIDGAYLLKALVSKDVYKYENSTFKKLGDAIYEELFIGNVQGTLNDLIIPEGVTMLRSYAFYQHDGILNVTIPDSVVFAGYSVFDRCRSLENVTIGNGLTDINEGMFSTCRALKNVTIGDNVRKIWLAAFVSCESLTHITIPSNVEEIHREVFKNCDSLETIVFENNSKLTGIGEYAFKDCTSLKSINIPDGVSRIEQETFRDCRALTSVNIPDNVDTIGDSAFSGCNSLTLDKLPESLVDIG